MDGTAKLLQRAIAEAGVTPFAALKTVSWGSGSGPLNELLPLWVPRGAHRGERADPVPRAYGRVSAGL